MRIVDALHAAHPQVSYDVTIKVEHLLRHRDFLSRLAETGCAFVTSAVESIDDRVLARLEKHHTRRDFVDAVAVCRAAGVALVPTFVAFHPWLSLEGYCELLDTIETLDLEMHVAPIQLAIRLLITEGSRLLELDDVPNARSRVRSGHADVSVGSSRRTRGCAAARAVRNDWRPVDGRSPHDLRCGQRSRARCCRTAETHVEAGARSRDGAVPERALVLLSGTEFRAGRSGVTKEGGWGR